MLMVSVSVEFNSASSESDPNHFLRKFLLGTAESNLYSEIAVDRALYRETAPRRGIFTKPQTLAICGKLGNLGVAHWHAAQV
jgi:hypothetical protein